jgi:toxin ParE1/3/4
MTSVRVRLTHSAERDLAEIENYIAADNANAAIDTVLRVLDSLVLLGEHAAMGRTGRIGGTREWVIPHTPFIAAYRESGDTVEILRVLHGARKWPKRL